MTLHEGDLGDEAFVASTQARVAPTQRSRARSRCRWANRMLKVLAMTSTETPKSMEKMRGSAGRSAAGPE